MLKDGLIHYWQFDEESGAVVHDVVGGQNGEHLPSPMASAAGVPGKFNLARDFSADDQGRSYVRLIAEDEDTAEPRGLSQWSASFWLKRADGIADPVGSGFSLFFAGRTFDDPNPVFRFESSDDGTYLWIDAGGFGDFVFRDVDKSGDGDFLFDGNWHLVVITDSFANGLRVYIDDVHITELDMDNPAGLPIKRWLSVGARPFSSGLSAGFDGIMDDVAIWDRELTSAERSNLWASGAGSRPITGGLAWETNPGAGGMAVLQDAAEERLSPPPAVHVWELDELSGSAVSDSVGQLAGEVVNDPNGTTVSEDGKFNNARDLGATEAASGLAGILLSSAPADTSPSYSTWTISLWIKRAFLAPGETVGGFATEKDIVLFGAGDPDSPATAPWIRITTDAEGKHLTAEITNDSQTRTLGFVVANAGNFDGEDTLFDGRWHFIALTSEAGSNNAARLYLDGQQSANDSFASGRALHPAYNAMIGLAPDDLTSAEVDISVDDVAVWDVELSPTLVDVLWNGGDGLSAVGANEGEPFEEFSEPPFVTAEVEFTLGDTVDAVVTPAGSPAFGLLRYWSMDDVAGSTAVSEAVADQDGVVENDPDNTTLGAAGKFAEAVDLGATNHVDGLASLDLSPSASDSGHQLQDFTISFWVRRNINGPVPTLDDTDTISLVDIRPTDSSATALRVRTGYEGKYLHTSAFGIDEGNDGVQTTEPVLGNLLFDGKWHLIVAALTKDPEGVAVYMDGDLVLSLTSANSFNDPHDVFPSSRIHMGVDGNSSALEPSFDGMFDDVALWDFAFTQADVDDLWNARAGRTAEGTVGEIQGDEYAEGLFGVSDEVAEEIRYGGAPVPWLRHYWPMDEQSGSAVDDVIGGLSGAMQDDPNDDTPTAGGKFGHGRDFGAADNADGVSSLLLNTTPDDTSLDEGNQWSISLWVKRESGTQNPIPDIGANQKVNLFEAGDTTVRISAGNLEGTTLEVVIRFSSFFAPTMTVDNNGEDLLFDGEWHLIVVVNDVPDDSTNEGRFRGIYLDGQLVSSATSASLFDMDLRLKPLMGVNESDNSISQFDGIIDETAIWLKALTEQEVQAMWDGGAGRTALGEIINDMSDTATLNDDTAVTSVRDVPVEVDETLTMDDQVDFAEDIFLAPEVANEVEVVDDIDDRAHFFNAVVASFAASADIDVRVSPAAMDGFKLRMSPTMVMRGDAHEVLRLSRGVSVAFAMLAEENLELGSDVALDLTYARSIVETLRVSSQATSIHEAVEMVAAAVVLSSFGTASLVEAANEAVEFLDDAVRDYRAVLLPIESLVLAEETESRRTAFVVMEDSFEVDGELSFRARLQAMVQEGLGVQLTFAADGALFDGWVINTANRAASRYDNYEINSIARVGSKYIGASKDGLMVLEGGTDNGRWIEARIRTGMTDFGRPELKNVQSAYLGFDSGGRVVLKTITAQDGERKERWYRSTHPRGTADGKARAVLGRGVASQYWQFELTNVEGGELDLDSLDFEVVSLTRRV